jgi:signal transduction histidine kinase
MLLVSFGLTVTGFLLSTLFSELQARGISEAAESIATNAAPSIEHLSRIRTELRHMEVRLDDCVDRAVLAGEPARGREEIQSSRRLLDQEWKLYVSLPSYPGEQALWPQTEGALARLDALVDEIFARLAAHDGRGAEHVLDEAVKPSIDRLDDRLRDEMAINAREASVRSARIMSRRQSARLLVILLDVLSVLFAAVLAWTAIGLVRRYAALMESRASELEQFAGRVAHDIRSPLSSVGLALEMALRRNELSAATHTSLARSTRTVRRLAQLVDGLLLFASAGARPRAEDSADLKTVLEGVAEQMLPAAMEKSIDLRVELEVTGQVACTPGVLISLTSNLVANAIKHMGDERVRSVVMRACAGTARARIEVEDTGPGIAPDQHARIFDPYVRAVESAIPGLGLGLATVRRLAEAHGGTVGVESKKGTGSRFWFELPWCADR